MAADTVLGIVRRDDLPDALALLHRGGYGPNTRVMNAGRGDLAGQLRRAGIAHPPSLDDQSQPLVMIFAPSRVADVVALLQRIGATAIHLAERSSDVQTASSLGFTFGRRPASPPPAPTQDQAPTAEPI
ncbi:MAG: hypothetical protein ACRDJH_02585 [Thermomicrobiales bacterium]